MKKILFVLFGVMALVLPVAAPANADITFPPSTRLLPYLWHSNDTGYDPAIIWKCTSSSPQEWMGENLKSYCDYPHWVYVRSGEEFWCYRYTTSADYGGDYKHWVKVADATGWHYNPSGKWDYGGCTERVD